MGAPGRSLTGVATAVTGHVTKVPPALQRQVSRSAHGRSAGQMPLPPAAAVATMAGGAASTEGQDP